MGKNLDYSTKKKIVFGVLIFLGITLLCLVTNLFSFYKSFLIGAFGLIIYPAIIIAMIFCGFYIANKVVSFDKKVLGLSIATLCLFLCILQMALTANLDFSSFASFVGASYGSKATPAGALFSILIYPFKYLLFDIGAYIVFSIAIIAMIGQGARIERLGLRLSILIGLIGLIERKGLKSLTKWLGKVKVQVLAFLLWG